MLIFVHVPDFYAAVELADHPAVERPIIVGGDPKKGGTVTSASAAARAAGVVDGLDLGEAQARCPEAELRPTRLRRYREIAAEIRAILRTASDRIEPQGHADTYLELPPSADALSVAAKLCVQIHGELGLPAAAGIGDSRFVANLAGLHAGSAGIREVSSEQALDFLGPFPVTAVWGLGPATAEKLAEAGVDNISQLQKMTRPELERVVGARHAGGFLELARGEDRSPLRPAPPAKSLSRETTLDSPSADLRTLGDDIAKLALAVADMLRRERRAARTVTLGVSFVDGERVSRMTTLDAPVVEPNEIAEPALQLLGRTQAGVRLVRRLRLQVTNLCRLEGERLPQQLRLF
jgi:DNA polymerase-4